MSLKVSSNARHAIRLLAAEIRKDMCSHFHNALFVGDIQERIKILRASGQSERDSLIKKKEIILGDFSF